MAKVKKQYPEDFKSLMGFSLPGLSIAFSSVIYGLFLQYLTDYSGIDEAIGTVGYAAAFGTVFLIISRIIDAADDPLQAFFMDRAKECKFGKYRKFTMMSIILIFFGMVAMFAIPHGVKSNGILLAIWVFAAYLIYDMGTAFNGITPILQKATTDAKVRTKVMTWHRMFLIIGAVPATFFVPIATIFNAKYNDMGKSVSVSCCLIVGFATILSLIGIACLKEPYRPELDAQGEAEEPLKFKDIVTMLKSNKAMWIHNIAFVVGNTAYGLSGAMLVYFMKWYYCADLTTGVVDNVKYATLAGVSSTLGIISAFCAPLLANYVTRKIGSVDKAARSCMLVSGIGYMILFVLYLTGMMKLNPMVYIVGNFLVGLPTSMATIPFLLLNVEVADYSEYKTGKNMTAMTTSVYNLLQKANSALSTALLGGMLMIVGYSVNSVTGAFSSNLDSLPGMITKMSLFVTIIPAVCCIACWLIYKFCYPITPKLREEMTAELQRRHSMEEAAVSEKA